MAPRNPDRLDSTPPFSMLTLLQMSLAPLLFICQILPSPRLPLTFVGLDRFFILP